MPRLRRSRPSSPGWTRRRQGKGVVFLDEDGNRITDPEAVARCTELVIPPAWTDVWICPWDNGHIQAMGTDDAGRRQYLYHPQWRARQDKAKHAHVLDVARRLPRARKVVREHLALPGMPREKVLALAFRLLDDAYFRAGGEAYARDNGSYGLATVRRDHVALHRDGVSFCYPAKSGQVRESKVEDTEILPIVRRLRDRDGDDDDELLAWQDDEGVWHDVTTADIVDYVKARLGPEARPKDFRTWHATVLAAAGLADHDPPSSERGRRRVVAQVVREVADELGNTPAVCRASYIDPRLVDLWERGRSIGRRRTRAAAERAVLELLS
ncbi:DNA topoisomerase IB [Cellulomonas carbonis]|uniref:DNA topoisomerase n=1 Tax=Cellulomonas carbonis T26 TaxID=947969 RepID=A0A0A0BNB5_9CELL|nr:DNA topoisomerase IB [Cellulomonas carbonis]KGM09152.1 DNA topoisomerase [Cellulomonas carbonis T26]GGB98478.1 DNA topoisomerase [Cellulomonas carbonis]